MEYLKIDLFHDDVFVFTPKGDLKNLPSGSTVLDFAYDIHSNIGDTCAGAKVNGKNVPIRHQLQNGDRVEIIILKNQNRWLNICRINNRKKV